MCSLWSYAKGSFGKTDIKLAADNSDKQGEANEICYTGGVYDETTEQYYLNARYYSPDAGNFLTQDSYRGTQEDENTWNLYAYCAGNPVNYVDPSGHFAIAIPLVIGAGSFLISARVTIDFSQKLYHVYQDTKTFVSKIEVKSTKPISSSKKLEAPKPNEEAKAKPKAGPAPIGKSSGSPGKDPKKGKKRDRASQLQKEVQKKQAPRKVKRVHPAKDGGKPHVHFTDGTSINNDGTLHDRGHGIPKITNKIAKWLEKHNWKTKIKK